MAVNRRFRNIIIKQSGFMQAARVICITGKSIRTVMEVNGVNFRQAAVRVLAKAFEYAWTVRIMDAPNGPHFTDSEVYQLVLCVWKIEKFTGMFVKVELSKAFFMQAVFMHLTDS